MKTTVIITNDMGNGTLLTVHCKSKDNDLGTHDIAEFASYSFSFRPNLFLTTLFFCSFAWQNEFKHFDVYVDKRDNRRCYPKCEWFIRPQGPCYKKSDGQEVCFPWNK
ncbi:hypothetical protein LWI29_021231 [Acer saccharum]|uniref:S-protein homolog n=1 Tax=Acer saccharum TaxID=4024 RepID=A0AA39SYZ8_ACESA|nr:hypothetical protein LWI29_021231 [Acer saccharum]KAK1591018.1 hypothetical protein Q3G72_000920 [Acer saccharum]